MSRGEFLARVIEIRSARLKKEQQAEAERQRLKAEAYQQHLVVVFKHADKKWVELDKLMEMKNATAYEAATNLLNELRDAYVQGGDEAAFQSKLSDFRIRYARRASMIRRIVDL